MPTITSREFNQDTSAAKRAARHGPVVITDRGTPSHVLLTYDAYTRLVGGPNIVNALACPEAAAVDFTVPRMAGTLLQPVEFD